MLIVSSHLSIIYLAGPIGIVLLADEMGRNGYTGRDGVNKSFGELEHDN